MGGKWITNSISFYRLCKIFLAIFTKKDATTLVYGVYIDTATGSLKMNRNSIDVDFNYVIRKNLSFFI